MCVKGIVAHMSAFSPRCQWRLLFKSWNPRNRSGKNIHCCLQWPENTNLKMLHTGRQNIQYSFLSMFVLVRTYIHTNSWTAESSGHLDDTAKAPFFCLAHCYNTLLKATPE